MNTQTKNKLNKKKPCFLPSQSSSMNQLTHIELLRKNQYKETNSVFQQSFPKNILHTMQSKRDRYIESVDEKQTREKHKNEKHTLTHKKCFKVNRA